MADIWELLFPVDLRRFELREYITLVTLWHKNEGLLKISEQERVRLTERKQLINKFAMNTSSRWSLR